MTSGKKPTKCCLSAIKMHSFSWQADLDDAQDNRKQISRLKAGCRPLMSLHTK